MQRVCFLLKLKNDKIQQYLKAHQVWPEMLDVMTRSGIQNYSIFLTDDGMLINYFEAEDPAKSLQLAGQSEVSKRWQKYISEYFETDGSQNFVCLNPVFYLK